MKAEPGRGGVGADSWQRHQFIENVGDLSVTGSKFPAQFLDERGAPLQTQRVNDPLNLREVCSCQIRRFGKPGYELQIDGDNTFRPGALKQDFSEQSVPALFSGPPGEILEVTFPPADQGTADSFSVFGRDNWYGAGSSLITGRGFLRHSSMFLATSRTTGTATEFPNCL